MKFKQTRLPVSYLSGTPIDYKGNLETVVEFPKDSIKLKQLIQRFKAPIIFSVTDELIEGIFLDVEFVPPQPEETVTS